jgi:hypothetical protein
MKFHFKGGVKMSRRRYVSTEISTDKATNKLGQLHGAIAVLLYTWMIPHAEDDRSITSDADEILLSVIPGFRSVSIDEVNTYIKAMVSLGLLENSDDGKLYFPENSFYKHQSYIPANKRNTANHRKSPQITASPSLSLSPLPLPSPLPSLSESDTNKSGELHPKPDIDAGLQKINNKAFDFEMNGITPEFRQDAEMRLKDGTDTELIIKALSTGATNAHGNAGAKCRYAITILQGWAADGIRTLEQWNAKNSPKQSARGEPQQKTRAESKREVILRAREEANKILDEEGITGDTS